MTMRWRCVSNEIVFLSFMHQLDPFVDIETDMTVRLWETVQYNQFNHRRIKRQTVVQRWAIAQKYRIAVSDDVSATTTTTTHFVDENYQMIAYWTTSNRRTDATATPAKINTESLTQSAQNKAQFHRQIDKERLVVWECVIWSTTAATKNDEFSIFFKLIAAAIAAASVCACVR